MGVAKKSLMIFMVLLAMTVAGKSFASPAIHGDPVNPAPAGSVIEFQPAAPEMQAEHPVTPEGETGHEQGHETKKAGLPQLDPVWYPSQFFWLLITFGLMYVTFSTLILPSLSKTIEGRRDHIQKDLDTAQALKEQAEAAQKQYQELLSGAFQNSSSLMEENEKDIKAKYDKAINDLRKEAVKQVEELETQIAATKKKAMNEMHDIAAEIASAAAKKIVGIDTDITQVRNVVKNIDKKAA